MEACPFNRDHLRGELGSRLCGLVLGGPSEPGGIPADQVTPEVRGPGMSWFGVVFNIDWSLAPVSQEHYP